MICQQIFVICCNSGNISLLQEIPHHVTFSLSEYIKTLREASEWIIYKIMFFLLFKFSVNCDNKWCKAKEVERLMRGGKCMVGRCGVPKHYY